MSYQRICDLVTKKNLSTPMKAFLLVSGLKWRGLFVFPRPTSSLGHSLIRVWRRQERSFQLLHLDSVVRVSPKRARNTSTIKSFTALTRWKNMGDCSSEFWLSERSKSLQQKIFFALVHQLTSIIAVNSSCYCW